MDPNRRMFLKKLTALGAGALVIPAWDSGFARDLNDAFLSLRQKSTMDAATSDDEWKIIRESFLFPQDFINLENGYHSPQPKPVLEFFLSETQRINTLTSRYMRTRLYKDWEQVRAELGAFSELDPETLALTRNTTESLDILISGMDLKAGDEVIVTEFDYGSMLQAFAQQEARYGIKVVTIKIPVVPSSDEELIEAF
jgi:selenocysteine lyase/cysteine desulfurase